MVGLCDSLWWPIPGLAIKSHFLVSVFNGASFLSLPIVKAGYEMKKIKK